MGVFYLLNTFPCSHLDVLADTLFFPKLVLDVVGIELVSLDLGRLPLDSESLLLIPEHLLVLIQDNLEDDY